MPQTLIPAVVTLAIATAGSALAIKCHIKAGAIFGAIAFTGAFSLISQRAVFLPECRTIMQIIVGVVIAGEISVSGLRQLRNYIGPGIFMTAFLLVLNLVIGFTVAKVTKLDLFTCLFAMIPGGMAEVSTIGAELGADLPMMAVFQTTRVLISYTLAPALIPIAAKRWGRTGCVVMDSTGSQEGPKQNGSYRSLSVTFVLALIGGLTAKRLGIPAGSILGSMLVAIPFKLITKQEYPTKRIKQIVQILVGTYVGSYVTFSFIKQVYRYLLPVVAGVLVFLAGCGIMGYLVHRLFKIDFSTAMFGCVPTGVSDMAIIASDLGGNGAQVIVLHLIRYLAVIAFFPVIFRLIASLSF